MWSAGHLAGLARAVRRRRVRDAGAVVVPPMRPVCAGLACGLPPGWGVGWGVRGMPGGPGGTGRASDGKGRRAGVCGAWLPEEKPNPKSRHGPFGNGDQRR